MTVPTRNLACVLWKSTRQVRARAAQNEWLDRYLHEGNANNASKPTTTNVNRRSTRLTADHPCIPAVRAAAQYPASSARPDVFPWGYFGVADRAVALLAGLRVPLRDASVVKGVPVTSVRVALLRPRSKRLLANDALVTLVTSSSHRSNSFIPRYSVSGSEA